MIAKERSNGPVLLIDAGDALAERSLVGAPPEMRTNAQSILAAMGKLGYDAMAVGERDLVLGVDELKRRAAEAKVTLLAANLFKDGKPVFEERKVIKVGAHRVGVFAVVSGEDYRRMGLELQKPEASRAQAQVAALKKAGAGLVIGLLHMDYDTALRVANEMKGVDYFIQSHDGRTSTTQKVQAAVFAPGGFEGRALGHAVFYDVDGKGPVFDRSEPEEARAQLAAVEGWIQNLRNEVKANPAQREVNQMRLDNELRHRKELVTKADSKPPPGRRSVMTDWLNLGANVASDPEIAKLVTPGK